MHFLKTFGYAFEITKPKAHHDGIEGIVLKRQGQCTSLIKMDIAMPETIDLLPGDPKHGFCHIHRIDMQVLVAAGLHPTNRPRVLDDAASHIKRGLKAIRKLRAGKAIT